VNAMMYLTLSWRNLWRNKKRTVIAAASVFFAVLLALVMRSGQTGSYAYMIDSSASQFTGYLQIQAAGYWEDRSLDRSIVIGSGQRKRIEAIPYITAFTPRLEAYALVSFGTATRVGQVIGIDPAAENAMTGLEKRLARGAYLSPEGPGALVAQGLSEVLKIGVGDDLVIYGQGYHGQLAAAKVPVAGVVKLPFSDMNNSLVYLSLKEAQDVFSTGDRMTSAALMVDGIRHLASVTDAVRGQLEDGLVVMTWDEMMPDLVQNIELDNASGIVMLIILYIVIAFGVFGTVMMMTSERGREFGILISVGMKRTRLVLVTTLETIFISFLGVAAGILAGIPIIYYLHFHPLHMTGDAAAAFEAIGVEPIMNFAVDPGIFLTQSVVVLVIALATALYPVVFIGRLRPAKALHG